MAAKGFGQWVGPEIAGMARAYANVRQTDRRRPSSRQSALYLTAVMPGRDSKKELRIYCDERQLYRPKKRHYLRLQRDDHGANQTAGR